MSVSILFDAAIESMPPLLSRDVQITRALLGTKKRLLVAERIELIDLVRKLTDTQISVAIRDDSMLEHATLYTILTEIENRSHALLKEQNPDSTAEAIATHWEELQAAHIEQLQRLDADSTSDAFSLAAEIETIERMQSRAKRTNYIKLADTHRKLIASEAINKRHRHGLSTKVDALRMIQSLLTVTEQRLGNVDEIAEAAIELVRNATNHTSNAAAVHA